MPPNVIEIVLLMLVAMAALSDLGARRIPNWLTVPGALCGFALQVWYSGSSGAAHSLEGLPAGLAMFILLFIAGGIGAGDVKLFAAVGAFLGPRLLLIDFVFTGLLGGAAVLAVTLRRGRLPATLPYGAVIAGGTLMSVIAN
jgi:prepilin peptidase CpaA